MNDNGVKRVFTSGATRDTALQPNGLPKPDYHRFLDVNVLDYFCAEYMLPHRKMADGSLREPDNWKQGFDGIDVPMASLTRHYWAVWKKWDGDAHNDARHCEEMLQDLCGVLFNSMVIMRELLKER